MNSAIELCKNLLIKPFEGCARVLPNGLVQAYPDPGTGGVPWTIGYGSTGPGIGPETVWTMQQCEQGLDEHMIYFYRGVMRLCPGLRDEPDRRVAAVVSWAYNCGLRNLEISTFRRRINEKDWEAAARECLRWNKAAGRVLRGLTRRRQVEAELLK